MENPGIPAQDCTARGYLRRTALLVLCGVGFAEEEHKHLSIPKPHK